MSALSIVRDDRKVVRLVANPIFLTSPLMVARGAQLSFEMFEADAGGLKPLVGMKQLYFLDDQLFWAELISLEACVSTHPGLRMLREKATLRGVFSIFGDAEAPN
jgi:hypothetical protein